MFKVKVNTVKGESDMESELLKTFDEEGNEVGVATREEVHKKGYWHETFHCWFVGQEAGKYYIYFQLRSDLKKDYPNLLDITAAGHLLADESVEDGIREVEEELGVEVAFNELVPLGVLKYSVTKGDLIDNELANGFLYINQKPMDEFKLQPEEVSGIVKVEFQSFYELWLDARKEVQIEGFVINAKDEKETVDKMVGKESFVPHEDTYYESILKMIGSHIGQIENVEV